MHRRLRRTMGLAAFLLAIAPAGAAVTGAGSPGLGAVLERYAEWDAERYVDWGASADAFDRRAAVLEEMLDALAGIDPGALDGVERDNYDVLRAVLEDISSYYRYEYLMPITARSGLHRRLAKLGADRSSWSAEAVATYAAELRKLPGTIDTTVVHLQRGLARGWTPPRASVAEVPRQVRALLDEGLVRMEWPFGEVMRAGARPGISALWRTYFDETKPAIEDAILRFLEYFEQTYLPQCRETIAIADLPGGLEWYALQFRTVVETDLSPEDVHALGLSEVRRIEREMMALIGDTAFAAERPPHAITEGHELFRDFNEHLRSSPRFRFETTDQAVDAYCRIAKTVDGWMPSISGTMPRLPYGIYASPPHLDLFEPLEYRPGSLRDRMPGVLFINVRSVDLHRTFEVLPLVLHETNPGHHHQLAVAQELDELPTFRRDWYSYAFGEGWALYAEFLGVELGLYRTPYEQLGRLSSEMHRACRMVVDTGVCVLGWTRDQAVDFMREKTPLSEDRIDREIDRFVTMPGQACAYKIGELRIRRLRDEAERRLGDAFDVRAFHDVLLGAGSVPLDVAERRVRAWLDEHDTALPR